MFSRSVLRRLGSVYSSSVRGLKGRGTIGHFYKARNQKNTKGIFCLFKRKISDSELDQNATWPDMVMFFWYLVKIDLPSVGYCKRVHWTSHFLQGNPITPKTRFLAQTCEILKDWSCAKLFLLKLSCFCSKWKQLRAGLSDRTNNVQPLW